jgi:transposase-like protein
MECRHCSGLCIKAGLQRNRAQKYRCKTCKKYQQAVYIFKNRASDIQQQITKLYREGVGIRGMARLLYASPPTTLRYILKIEKAIPPPTEKSLGINKLNTKIPYKECKRGFLPEHTNPFKSSAPSPSSKSKYPLLE